MDRFSRWFWPHTLRWPHDYLGKRLAQFKFSRRRQWQLALHTVLQRLNISGIRPDRLLLTLGQRVSQQYDCVHWYSYSKRQRDLKEGCCVGLLAERESRWIAERSTAKKHHRKQLRDRLWKADESCCKRNDVSTICLTNKFAKPWKSLAQGTTGRDAANFLRHHFFCSFSLDRNGETGATFWKWMERWFLQDYITT